MMQALLLAAALTVSSLWCPTNKWCDSTTGVVIGPAPAPAPTATSSPCILISSCENTSPDMNEWFCVANCDNNPIYPFNVPTPAPFVIIGTDRCDRLDYLALHKLLESEAVNAALYDMLDSAPDATWDHYQRKFDHLMAQSTRYQYLTDKCRAGL